MKLTNFVKTSTASASAIKIAIASVLLLSLITAQANAAKLTTKEVAYFGDTRGFLAMPKNAAGAPALILIHEWWGLNDQIRQQAREFAAAGYVALAVDLYAGQSTTKPQRARELATKVGKNSPAAFANLTAAAKYLRALPQTDASRLGSVGWCFGGGWSYQIAKNNLGAKASVIYYGRFNPADDLSKMRATIMGHFGENDRAIKVDDVRQFQAKLQTLTGAHEVFIYPNAGHGFANPSNPAHDKAAAKTANQRTVSFLNKHL